MLNLPKYFQPKFTSKLIRLGRNNDGGYVVSEDAIKASDSLYSFGLDDDWSFEKSFYALNNSKVYVYDSSVTLIYWIKKNILNFRDLIFFKKNLKDFLKYIFIFFKYNYFFDNKKKFHIKKHVSSDRYIKNVKNKVNNEINFKEIFNSENKNIFLKIDIEGNEYKILDDIIKFQKRFTGITIEFHSCDLMMDAIKFFLKNLKMDLIHLHVNNFSEITKKKIPTVIEMTFSKRKFNFKRRKKIKYPIKGLDQPNDKRSSDKKINFKNIF